MAPKKKITNEMILEAAFNITRELGFESVNARSLAKSIGCSTQPIFSRYENMNVLNKEFHLYVGNYFNQYAFEMMKGENPIRQLGLAYINFAKDESNLFRLLFMSEMMELNRFEDMFNDDDNLEVANTISEKLSIRVENAKNLYMKIWIFNHGIASLIATKSINLGDGEAEKMMNDGYEAFVMQAKSIRGNN